MYSALLSSIHFTGTLFPCHTSACSMNGIYAILVWSFQYPSHHYGAISVGLGFQYLCTVMCNINFEIHRNLAIWSLTSILGLGHFALTSCSRKRAFIVPFDQKSIAWASSFIEIVLTRRKLPTNTTFWMPWRQQ